MSKTKSQNEQIEILQHDIFDAIFSLMILQGHKSIRLRSHYDEACVAVYKKVEKMCDESDKYCGFYFVQHPIHGDSQLARDSLREWCSCGAMNVRVPGDGTYYFDLTLAEAEKWLTKSIQYTTFSREDFDKLTKIFLNIYSQ
ncbi:hypothetical protein H0W80_01735 [Candidatus Saccharibacteria bacterium]|nr:hypothetical protein [Candidatus Saccharibacteria bacterium]